MDALSELAQGTISPAKAAAMLGVSRQRVYAWIAEGRLPAGGKPITIATEDLLAFRARWKRWTKQAQ